MCDGDLEELVRNYTGPNPIALSSVAEVIDQFFTEIYADIDLKLATLILTRDGSIDNSWKKKKPWNPPRK